MIALSQIVGSPTSSSSSSTAAAGRTTTLGQATVTHLNVHGALTNCATCIAPAEESRLCTADRTIARLCEGEDAEVTAAAEEEFWKSVTRAYFYSSPGLHVGEKRHGGEFYETRLRASIERLRKKGNPDLLLLCKTIRSLVNCSLIFFH